MECSLPWNVQPLKIHRKVFCLINHRTQDKEDMYRNQLSTKFSGSNPRLAEQGCGQVMQGSEIRLAINNSATRVRKIWVQHSPGGARSWRTAGNESWRISTNSKLQSSNSHPRLAHKTKHKAITRMFAKKLLSLDQNHQWNIEDDEMNTESRSRARGAWSLATKRSS